MNVKFDAILGKTRETDGGGGEESSDGGFYPLFPCRTYANDEYGCVAWLDADNSLELAGYYGNEITAVELFLVSANSATAGNIVLQIGANTLVVPVSGSVAKVEIPLAVPVSGRISIVRDTTSVLDTLNDGIDAITALVVDGRMF